MIDAERKVVAVEWGIEDVQSVRPDLDDDQSWQVLVMAYENHNAEIGLNWDSFKYWADDLFPEVANAS